MKTPKEIERMLVAPFPAGSIEVLPLPSGEIKGKPGEQGTTYATCYVTARAVAERLTEAFGPDGWERHVRTITRRTADGPKAEDELIWVTTLRVRWAEGQWLEYEEVSDETDIAAEKGGSSGSFKRAAALIGVGRYLYYLDNVKVEGKIVQSRGGKLSVRVPFNFTPKLPSWALPGGTGRPPSMEVQTKAAPTPEPEPKPRDPEPTYEPAPEPKLDLSNPEGMIEWLGRQPTPVYDGAIQPLGVSVGEIPDGAPLGDDRPLLMFPWLSMDKWGAMPQAMQRIIVSGPHAGRRLGEAAYDPKLRQWMRLLEKNERIPAPMRAAIGHLADLCKDIHQAYLESTGDLPTTEETT